MFLFEIIVWTLVGLVYLGGIFWAFRDFMDLDNILYHEKEEWYTNEDKHIGI